MFQFDAIWMVKCMTHTHGKSNDHKTKHTELKTSEQNENKSRETKKLKTEQDKKKYMIIQ